MTVTLILSNLVKLTRFHTVVSISITIKWQILEITSKSWGSYSFVPYAWNVFWNHLFDSWIQDFVNKWKELKVLNWQGKYCHAMNYASQFVVYGCTSPFETTVLWLLAFEFWKGLTVGLHNNCSRTQSSYILCSNVLPILFCGMKRMQLFTSSTSAQH